MPDDTDDIDTPDEDTGTLVLADPDSHDDDKPFCC